MRLTIKQIKQIKRLRQKKETVRGIAKKFNVNPSTISYHLDKEEKLLKLKKWWNKKSKEEKNEIYKKRNPYMTKYQRERYNSDEEFREKNKKRSREYHARKSSNRNKNKN